MIIVDSISTINGNYWNNHTIGEGKNRWMSSFRWGNDPSYRQLLWSCEALGVGVGDDLYFTGVR